jgi:hypothetical protein
VSHHLRVADAASASDDPDVRDVAVAIREAFEDHPNGPYSGIVVDHQALAVTVFRVPGDAAFDQSARRFAAPRVTVWLRDAPRRRHENEAIRDEVMAATDLPIKVWGAGPRGDASGVDVVAEGDLDRAQRILDGRYGPGAVRLERGRITPL